MVCGYTRCGSGWGRRILVASHRPILIGGLRGLCVRTRGRGEGRWRRGRLLEHAGKYGVKETV